MGIIDEAIMAALNPILPAQPDPPTADQAATNPGGVQPPSVPSGPNLGQIAGALGPALQVAVAAIALQVICDKVPLPIPGCGGGGGGGNDPTPTPTPTPTGGREDPPGGLFDEFALFYDPTNPRDTAYQACNSAPFTPEEYSLLALSKVYHRSGSLYLDAYGDATVRAGYYLGTALENDVFGYFDYRGDGTLPGFNPQSCSSVSSGGTNGGTGGGGTGGQLPPGDGETSVVDKTTLG